MKLITRRSLLRSSLIAAPALITSRDAIAQFSGCLPGFCSPGGGTPPPYTCAGPISFTTPLDIPGLLDWWDPTVLASLSLSGTDINSITSVTGLSTVLSWVGFNKPKYSATVLNGFPAMDLLSVTVAGYVQSSIGYAMGTGNSLTCWCVMRQDNPTNHFGSANARLLSYSPPGGDDHSVGGGWGLSQPGVVTPQQSNGHMSMEWSSDGLSAFPAVVGGLFYRYIMTMDALGNQVLYINGVMAEVVGYVDTVPPGTRTKAPSNWVSGGTIAIGGSSFNVNHFWDGVLGEVGLATTCSGITTIASLDAYLKAKYSLSDYTIATLDASTAVACTITGSGATKVATSTGTTATNQGVTPATGTYGFTTGKYYFEVQRTNTTVGDNVGVGVMAVGTPYSTFGPDGTGGASIHFNGGQTYSNGVAGPALGAVTVGANGWVGVAVDLDNRKIWYYLFGIGWNGGGGGQDPNTNTGGYVIPAGTMVPCITFGGTSGAAGDIVTSNFGGTVPVFRHGNAAPPAFLPAWIV